MMKRMMGLVLGFIIIFTGCSTNNIEKENLTKEIATLKEEVATLNEECQRLQEELDTLKRSQTIDNQNKEGQSSSVYSNDGIEVTEKDSNELSINKGIYSNSYNDTTVEYTLKKYGYQKTYTYGDKKNNWDNTTDGKFAILEVYLDNIGKEEYNMSIPKLSVIDTKGRRYRCVDAYDKEKKGVGIFAIKPGFNSTIYAIFEMASDAEVNKFIINDEEERSGLDKIKGLVIKIDVDKLENKEFEFIS